MAGTDVLIPKGFAGVPLLHPEKTVRRFKFSPGNEAVVRVILRSCEFLGVTRYQLSQLLGLPRPTQLWEWLNGRYAPSSLYTHRLLFLWDLRVRGAPLAHVSRIDWEKGEVYWRRGFGPEE